MSAPPLPSLWTLSCQGITRTAAGAGVTGMTRHRANRAADTCTLRFDGRPFDAAPPFPFGETVTVLRAGTPWFVGRVTSVPASGDGGAESLVCTMTGPWWYLAQLVCQQQWTLRGGAATASLSRLVLGQAADGTRLNTGQVIVETLQYAIDAGAPFAIGTVDPSFLAPLDEVKDITCAHVIQRMLRWHPDCVAWFDYAASPVPVFHCRARANLPAATLTVGTPPLAAVRGLTARHDLQVPAVVFHYETTSRANGQVLTDVTTDAAPPGATGREFGAVVGTIPLRGETATVLTQRIVTEPIVFNSADPALVPQLIRLSPVLAVYAADPEITADGITITSFGRVVVSGSGAGGDDGGGGGGFGTGIFLSFGNALVSGEITDWMMADYSLHTQTQRLTFTYTLTRNDGTGGPPVVSAPQTGTIDLTATDAATGLYTTLSTYRPGDTAPTGQAAAFLAAFPALAYSGSVVLVEPEAGGVASAGLGGVVNVAGGAAADWAAMRATVIEETLNAADGTTTLTLGPAGELGVATLAAALKTTGAASGTAALGTASSASRATGVPG